MPLYQHHATRVRQARSAEEVLLILQEFEAVQAEFQDEACEVELDEGALEAAWRDLMEEYHEILRSAPFVPDALIEERAEGERDSWKMLLQNPALTRRQKERMLRRTEELLRARREERGVVLTENVLSFAGAWFRAEDPASFGPLTRELWALFDHLEATPPPAEADPRLREGRSLEQSLVAHTLLANPQLTQNELLRLARPPLELFFAPSPADLAAHPGAHLELWRLLISEGRPSSLGLRQTLAQIPAARRDPTIRAHLTSRANWDGEILYALCLEAGEGTRAAFHRFRQFHPGGVAMLLADPDFEIQHLTQADLLPFLSSPDSTLRLAAIAASALVEGHGRKESAEAREERERNWRQRHQRLREQDWNLLPF